MNAIPKPIGMKQPKMVFNSVKINLSIILYLKFIIIY